MSELKVRPRRRLRSELLVLSLVLVATAAVVAAFPFEAIGFSVEEGASADPSCRFVTLSPAEEAAVQAAARAAWQVGVEGVRQLQADLLSTERMKLDASPSVPLEERTRFRRDNAAAYVLEVVPPALSVAAPLPAAIPADGSVRPRPVFPREELLQL